MRYSPRIRTIGQIALTLMLTLFLAAPVLAQEEAEDGILPLSTESEAAAAHFRMGLVEMQNLGGARAGRHFEQAIEADASFGLAHFFHAMATAPFAERNDRMQAAIGMMGSATSEELLFATAFRELSGGGNPAMGAQLFAILAEAVPGDAEVAMYASQMSGATGDQTDVVARWQNLVAEHPGLGAAHNLLAYAQWNRGQKAAALESARKYLELMPEHPNPHDTYAELQQYNGNFPAAFEHYSHAVEADPSFVQGYTGKAELLQLVGAIDASQAQLELAIEHAPTDNARVAAMRAMANSHLLAGHHEVTMEHLAAATQAAEAAELTNATVTTHRHAAMASGHFGDAEGVTAHLAAAAAASTNPEAPAQLAAGALAHAMAGNAAEATRYADALDEATSAGFWASRGHTARAMILLSEGNADSAMDHLAQANPSSLMVQAGMAEAFAAQGRMAAAAAKRNEVANDRQLALGNIWEIYARARMMNDE